MSAVSFSEISKNFGKVEVLKSIDLQIADGEFVVLLGPSGCGKSTLLRIAAGLEDQSAGQVMIGGRQVDHLPPAKRGVAMVFQTYALYPHLDVAGNWSIGLKQARMPANEIERRIQEAARMLSLEELLNRKPGQLSGGQRQRVAIGRAIVRQPEVMLFDEPLSNLDAALRSQVRFEIARLHKLLKSTIIYVTHDQIEAMTLADRIVVMNNGVVQQQGSPHQLYESPANRYVAGFIGAPAMNFILNGQEEWGVRPDGLNLSDNGDYSGQVMLVEYLGRQSYCHVQLDSGQTLIIECDPQIEVNIGDNVGVSILPDAIHRFSASSGERLN